MPIGSSKQAAVPTTPSSFNSPSPRVHDPHGPPDLHPRTRAYLLAPGLQTPDVSSEGPDEARAGREGGRGECRRWNTVCRHNSKPS